MDKAFDDVTYTKLDPEFKKVWLEALRSGKYKQARQTLRLVRNSRPLYCCIGVAGVKMKLMREVARFSASHATDHISMKMGLDMATAAHLVRMNDTEQLSFTEIADWIEANL